MDLHRLHRHEYYCSSQKFDNNGIEIREDSITNHNCMIEKKMFPATKVQRGIKLENLTSSR
jgi:hypothetical protein